MNIVVNRVKGFTAIELMIVVSVLGVLLAVGMPNLQDTIDRINSNSRAKTLVSSLNLARSEAIKRGGVASICATNNGTDCVAGAWSQGWVVFIDNDGNATGSAGSIGAGDEIVRVYEGMGNSVLTFTANILQYNAQGFGTNTAVQTFLLCPQNGNAMNAQSVEISLTGRGRRIHDGLACP